MKDYLPASDMQWSLGCERKIRHTSHDYQPASALRLLKGYDMPSLEHWFSSTSLHNRRYFLRFAGERRPAQSERGSRDTRDWGRRVSGAPCSLTVRTLDISSGVVGLKTAVLGRTLILASTDVANNSLTWIFSLLELSLDLSGTCNSLSKSTLFHTSAGLSSTPAVLFLEKN